MSKQAATVDQQKMTMLRRRNLRLEHSLLVLNHDYAKLAKKQTSVIGKVHRYLVNASSIKKCLALLSFISVGTSIAVNLMSLRRLLKKG